MIVQQIGFFHLKLVKIIYFFKFPNIFIRMLTHVSVSWISWRFGVNLLGKNFRSVFFSSFFIDFILLIFVSFKILWVINPFLTNFLISYPRKAAEYLRFYGIFRGYKMGALPRNGLRHSVCSTLCTSKRCLKMTAKLGRWGLSG